MANVKQMTQCLADVLSCQHRALEVNLSIENVDIQEVDKLNYFADELGITGVCCM